MYEDKNTVRNPKFIKKRIEVVILVGEHSNFKKIPTHTQDHGDA